MPDCSRQPEYKYIFGPVPSRRLGRSLGVDIMPKKICTLDCIYCQIGCTTEKTLERKPYVPIEPVLAELKEKLAAGIETDYITISGSGEPTLNSRLGELIDGIREITDTPIAILTNGTLLCRKDVRADCAKADLVAPSLDAADEITFQKINHPHPNLNVEVLISGIAKFRQEFAGQVWLEVFLIAPHNTEKPQIAKIKEAISLISPDRIQLNTAVRPTTDPTVKGIGINKLQAIANQLGSNCEVISPGQLTTPADTNRPDSEQLSKTILSVLKRRPCTIADLASSLNVASSQLTKLLAELQAAGLIQTTKKDSSIFFEIK